MTRAPDGTYWRVKYEVSSYDAIVDDSYWGECRTVKLTREQADKFVQDHHSNACFRNFRIIPYRPRVSIVRAVKLLTEARKQGFELWMKPRACLGWWAKLDGFDKFYWESSNHRCDSMASAQFLLSKWIVATPSDARKIDARKSKT